MGGFCRENGFCAAGLSCRSEACGEKPKEGEACSRIDDCADGLACDGKCRTYAYVGTDRECDATRRCERGLCVQPVTQGANGQQAAAGPATCLAPLEDGETCGATQQQQGRVCDHFARCVGDKGMLADPARCQ
jgi:hypothetical protein